MASVGQACWQAVITSLSISVRFSFFAFSLPSCKRCTQKLHFSMTPLERTVTSGFNTMRVRSSFIIRTASFSLPTPCLILVIRETVCSCIIFPVEAAYFERTVICTISGTDTTVICHLVQPFLLWLVAETGQTFSQGALSQCWQSIGWKTVSILSGSDRFPVKYRSMRNQCIS